MLLMLAVFDLIAAALPLYTYSAAALAIQTTTSTTAARYATFADCMRVFLLQLNLPTDLTVVLPASSDCALRLFLV